MEAVTIKDIGSVLGHIFGAASKSESVDEALAKSATTPDPAKDREDAVIANFDAGVNRMDDQRQP
jgi:hypothetical protein